MAADVITRFKLETTQYDSKLRDAAKGLKEVVKQAELAGKDFKGFEKNTLEAAKALGTIETGANNSKDKVKELVGAFNEMAKTYNSMSQEIRDGDVGQAISKSLTQLSGRIKEAKEELYSLGETAKSSGGLFGEGGLTGMLQVAGGNLISSGIQKLGSEMVDTIQKGIELAKQGEGIRLAFERLNRPGLLDNLKEATHGTVSEIELMKAAVKFDDFKLPVEQLGTMLEFAQKKAKDTGQSVDYMVDSIVTGLGRKSLMILDNLGLSAAQVKEKMAETGDMTSAVAAIIKEQMSEAGEYVETAADRAARAAADATNEMERLGREAQPFAEEWAKAWNEIKIGGMSLLTTVLGPLAESARQIRNILNGDFSFKAGIPNLANGASPYTKTIGTDHTVYAPGGYVEVTDSNTGAVIGGQHFDNLNDANTIKAWQKSLFKTPKTGSGKKTTPSIGDFDKALAKSLTGSVDLKEVKDQLSPFQMMLPEIEKNILGIKDADLGGALAELGNKKVVAEIATVTKEIEQQKMAFDMAAQSAATFGSALAGIQDPSIKAAGTVIQAIANIALGFSQAAAQASSMGSYGWIAYLAAGTAAMATTISTIHSLTGYAEGGEIKGNSYSGDQIPIMANAGEIVLNQAQQSNVAGALRGNGFGQMRIVGVLQGTQLLMCIDNTTKSMGMGEIATFKNSN